MHDIIRTNVIHFQSISDQAGEAEVKNFQNELNIMKKVGRHINIVSLVGSCEHSG